MRTHSTRISTSQQGTQTEFCPTLGRELSLLGLAERCQTDAGVSLLRGKTQSKSQTISATGTKTFQLKQVGEERRAEERRGEERRGEERRGEERRVHRRKEERSHMRGEERRGEERRGE
ncbi:hypothetical protein FK515_29300, partial [Klebsiella pneumoniae]|nr:hypothetical protein [Klebsiella pneumoniae]